jgi:hypothetical protein
VKSTYILTNVFSDGGTERGESEATKRQGAVEGREEDGVVRGGGRGVEGKGVTRT